MDTKFYINTEANDDDAYQSAIQFAMALSLKDPEVQKIVLYIHTKQNTGWFDRLYGREIVKRLFNGVKFNDCPAIFKFETKLTYQKSQYGSGSHVVICCGIDSDDIFKIDDYHYAKYIIAIPWLKKNTDKWIKTWKAKEISGNDELEEEQTIEPSPIVKLAMKQLTHTINMSTGINHPMDNERAKTYIKSLHKYESELDPDIVGTYLIKDLGWSTKHAKEVENLIETLNDGRYFKGGQKTGLQNYYKKWKNECS